MKLNNLKEVDFQKLFMPSFINFVYFVYFVHNIVE